VVAVRRIVPAADRIEEAVNNTRSYSRARHRQITQPQPDVLLWVEAFHVRQRVTQITAGHVYDLRSTVSVSTQVQRTGFR